MTKLSVTKVLAGAATAAALTIALSGNALAHFGGMNGHMGGNMGGNLTGTLSHTTNLIGTNNLVSQTTKVTDMSKHFRDRRFRFLRFGSVDIDPAPACFYKWTSIGRVRICPDLDY